MRNPFSLGDEREFFGNAGKGIGMALGVKFFVVDFILWLFGVLVAVGSVGMRLYLRKKQGTAALGFAWITLFFHLGLVFVFFLFFTNMVSTNLSVERMWKYLVSNKFFLFYIAGLLIAVVFHLFRDFEPSRKGMERDPFYSGKGVFNFLTRGSYRKELYMNLLDPFLAGIIGFWFLMQKGGEALGYFIIFSATCLLVETMALLAVDWRFRQVKIGAEAFREEYGQEITNRQVGQKGERKKPIID